MTSRKLLLAQIEAFCRARGMTERAFGLTVMGDHKFVPRIRRGSGVNSATHDRIEAFLRGEPLPPRMSRRRTATAAESRMSA